MTSTSLTQEITKAWGLHGSPLPKDSTSTMVQGCGGVGVEHTPFPPGRVTPQQGTVDKDTATQGVVDADTVTQDSVWRRRKFWAKRL